MKTLIALLALLLGGGAAQAAPDMFREQPGTSGFLYEITPKKGPGKAYLFGTIHVGTEEMRPFTHAVMTALGASQRLALEVDLSDLGAQVDAMKKAMQAGAEVTRGAQLPAAQLAEALPIFAEEGISADVAKGMPVWMLGMSLMMAEVKALGLSMSHGADQYLLAYAQRKGLPLIGLETIELQMNALASIPGPVQLEAFGEALADHKSGKAARKLKELVTMWRTSDDKGMRAEILQQETGKRASERVFHKALLESRNVGMVRRAEELVKDGKTTFIGVGAAHLFGRSGLVEQLGKRGYVVRPIH